MRNVPELYVRQDIGQGQPMVLLHGMFGDGTQWRVIADLLSDYYRVIVVDLLGHGKSPRPKGAQYTSHEHSRALRKTLEKLKATDNATIVGYSMGGTVALQYSADYHDVSELFMISTPFYLKPEEMVEAGYSNSLFYTKLSVGLFRQVDRLLRPNKLLYKIIERDRLTKWLQVLIDAYDNQLDPEVTRLNLKHLINEYPFAKILAKVRAPVTFYSGKRDVFVVQAQLRALKRIQPLMLTETLSIVKNDHMLVQYLPQQMVKVLTQYHQQTLHVGQDSGKGRVFVLLHGIETSSSYWANFADVLATKYRVITLDLLGFGESPKPLNISYSLDEQVVWVKRTLDQLGVTSFSLIGHSLGALVALEYTATYEKDVRKLYLVAPVFLGAAKTNQRRLIKRLTYVDYFSDDGYLVSSAARAVGTTRLSKFTPTIRSIHNAVRNQRSSSLAKQIKSTPVSILYGEKDQLVDEHQLGVVAKLLPDAQVAALPDAGHNFVLDKPQVLMNVVDDGLSAKKFKKTTFQPKHVLQQLVRLALPSLLIKAILYIVAGVLLFSQYRAEVLVAGVVGLVMLQSAQFIRGSFSLKNEGLSYLSYFGLGIFGVVAGYLLATRFNFTLWVSLVIVCGYIFAIGFARVFSAFFLPKGSRFKYKLFVTGGLCVLVSGAAFLGSVKSVYAIVFVLGTYLLIRGFIFLSYLALSLLAAYVRSI